MQSWMWCSRKRCFRLQCFLTEASTQCTTIQKWVYNMIILIILMIMIVIIIYSKSVTHSHWHANAQHAVVNLMQIVYIIIRRCRAKISRFFSFFFTLIANSPFVSQSYNDTCPRRKGKIHVGKVHVCNRHLRNVGPLQTLFVRNSYEPGRTTSRAYVMYRMCIKKNIAYGTHKSGLNPCSNSISVGLTRYFLDFPTGIITTYEHVPVRTRKN
jgi:hypothetical protein